MSETLKEYEAKAISLLTAKIFSLEQLDQIFKNYRFVRYEHTGVGYFLTVSHSLLSKQRIVCDKPMISGTADMISYGFVVFIENGELTLECHSWDGETIPEDFRDRDIKVQ